MATMDNSIPGDVQTVTVQQAEKIIDDHAPVGKYLIQERYGQTDLFTGIRCTQDGSAKALAFRKRAKCLDWLETGREE